MEIDFRRYQPGSIPVLFEKAMSHLASTGRAGVAEVAARLGITRGYAYKMLAGDSVGRYPIQVMLERLLEPGGDEIVDAAKHYDPGRAPELVQRAVATLGTQLSLARRLGVSRDYLRKLANGQRQMTFGVQVMLEELAPRPPP